MRASGLGAEQRASADGVSRERGNRAARLLVHGAHARVGARGAPSPTCLERGASAGRRRARTERDARRDRDKRVLELVPGVGSGGPATGRRGRHKRVPGGVGSGGPVLHLERRVPASRS